jgi:hypothetical protein
MQGKGEDTVLAHINPLEAMMLQQMGGSGTINPKTGLPQFGLFSNPGKWLKSVIGPAVGTVVGNMILPGIGGVIGGGLGGGIGSVVRGRKDAGQASLRGAAIGAMAPTAASFAGSGLSSLGANNVGEALSRYGTTNAILPSIGMESGSTTGANAVRNSTLSGISAGDEAEGQIKGKAKEQSFIDSLMGKSKNFFSEPGNLLTTGVVANALFNKPKEKSPEKLGAEEKRKARALRLTPAELAEKEAYDLALEHARRRNERKKFLPEERINIEPLYTRTNTPEEYGRTGRWLNHYNNPEYAGNPVMMKEGGEANPKGFLEIEEMEYPSGLGRYIVGKTGGQDDKIPALLSDGEYVVRADDVANLGDGNNAAGAKKLDIGFEKLRKHKGGSIKLPPKAKSLASYLK